MTPAWRRGLSATLSLSSHSTRGRLMEKIIRPMSPLRRRILRRHADTATIPPTPSMGICALADFAKHFGTSPDRLWPRHIPPINSISSSSRSPSIFIQTVCALRFVRDHLASLVDGRLYPVPQEAEDPPCHPGRRSEGVATRPTLPQASRDLATLYATGVRVSELCHPPPGHRHRLPTDGDPRPPGQGQTRSYGHVSLLVQRIAVTARQQCADSLPFLRDAR